MKIFIGADIVPTKSNIEAFSSGRVSAIIDENLEKKLEEADFRIFNLETPLTDMEAPIKKCGPNLIAPTSCVKGIKKLGVDLFALANNHIMDHGEEAFRETLKTLSENEIAYFGAGENLSEAQKPYIIEKDGKRIGIYACTEHEFSIAEENACGANPFDALESLDHIANLKNECDYVIALYHGGKENYRYPSPYLQKVCRKICDKGADLVVCQHSHCIGCEEKYSDSTIVYGQGNFIFDATERESWQTSLLVSVNVEENFSIEYISLRKRGSGVSIAEDEKILDSFYKRSEEIAQKDFIEKTYIEFANSMLDGYINAFCGTSIFYRVLNKLCGHRLRRKINQKRRLKIRNYVECEAHRELLLTGLKNVEK